MTPISQPNSRLVVYVNDKPKPLHLGLRVRHAIGPRRTRSVLGHRSIVQDSEGNTIDVDGALYDGERLYIVKTTPTEFADQIIKRAAGLNRK